MLTFQQGTKVILDNGTNRYIFSISSASASQTFLGSSRSVSTIHKPNLLEENRSTEKSTANLSIDCSMVNDPVLLEWFSLVESTGKYYVDSTILEVKQYTVYIVSTGTIYKIDNCVAQTMSVTLSKASVLQVNITAVGSDISIVPSMPATGLIIPQGVPYGGAVQVTGYNRLSTVSCEITREIKWVGAKSIFDIGSIYKKSKPLASSLSISGTITQNKDSDSPVEYLYSTPVSILFGDTFKINLQSCSTTSRWDMASIHKRVTDYKLQPENSGSYIQF